MLVLGLALTAGCVSTAERPGAAEPDASLPPDAAGEPAPDGASAAEATPVSTTRDEGAAAGAQDASEATPDEAAAFTAPQESQPKDAERVDELLSGPEPLPEWGLADDDDDDDSGLAPVRGFLSARYVRRHKGGEDDNDLFAYLSMEGGDPNRDRITWQLDARLWRDLDGDDDDNPVFFSINDTFGDTNALLYNAYVDVHGSQDLELLRVGRQSDYETPVPVFFDGVHVRTRAMGDAETKVGAYGGLSTYQYQRGSRRKDGIYGVYAEARPWEDGRVRLDWIHSENERTFNTYHDDLFGIHVWQSLMDRKLRLEGYYSRFESDDRDLSFSGTYVEPEQDLVVRASYYELLDTEKMSAIEFDPLSTALGQLFPYRQIQASVSKGIAERVTLLGGVSVRRVDDSDDKGTYNRDVEQYYLTGTVDRFFDDLNVFSLTGTWWDGDGRDHGSWGADFTRAVSEDLDLSVGTFYSLYKVDMQSGTEREDEQVYYARVDWDISESYSTDLAYELEDSDIGTFHNLMAKLTWRF